MTLPLLFTQLLTTFSSPDFLQSCCAIRLYLRGWETRGYQGQLTGGLPKAGHWADPQSVDASKLSGAVSLQVLTWSGIRSLQLEGTRIQSWLLDKWLFVLLLRRPMLYVFSVCCTADLHSREGEGLWYWSCFHLQKCCFLVLYVFICVLATCTHRCVCVLTGSTQATLMLPGPGETKMQAASLLLSY